MEPDGGGPQADSGRVHRCKNQGGDNEGDSVLGFEYAAHCKNDRASPLRRLARFHGGMVPAGSGLKSLHAVSDIDMGHQRRCKSSKMRWNFKTTENMNFHGRVSRIKLKSRKSQSCIDDDCWI